MSYVNFTGNCLAHPGRITVKYEYIEGKDCYKYMVEFQDKDMWGNNSGFVKMDINAYLSYLTNPFFKSCLVNNSSKSSDELRVMITESVKSTDESVVDNSLKF